MTWGGEMRPRQARPVRRRRVGHGLRALSAATIATVALAAVGGTPASAAVPEIVTDPASFVNPFIGTTNLGNTYPGAVTPFGMLAWSPQTSRGNQFATPAPGGYQYTATMIRGFSLTHLSGVGCSGANGDIPIMPHVGEIAGSPTADTTDAVYASTFSHANESAKPGYYKVRSEEHTSELQSRPHLVCRLLLEKKKN